MDSKPDYDIREFNEEARAVLAAVSEWGIREGAVDVYVVESRGTFYVEVGSPALIRSWERLVWSNGEYCD